MGAGLATLFGLPQLIGALGGAPGVTKSVAEALQDFGINVGSFAVLAFLVQRDLQVCAAAAGASVLLCLHCVRLRCPEWDGALRVCPCLCC